jgi:surface protein
MHLSVLRICTLTVLLLVPGFFVSAAPIVPGSFSTTWKTDNPGTTATNQIRIPTTGTGYNYDIYWENVASSTQNGTLTGRTGATTITFPSIGTYRVDITGSFPRIYFNNGGDRRKILTIEQWGNIAWTSMENAFYGASNLQGVAADVPNLASVTSLNSMFFNASAFNQDINNWDVSNITNMNQMFYAATAFNQPLDQWDVSNVTNMTQLFYNAGAFNQPLNSWNVSNVTSMFLMFSGASAFNQPLDQWAVQPAISLNGMFNDTAFNQDFTTWAWLYDPARTSWSGLLRGADAFTQDISDLVIPSNITNLSHFFALNETFNQDISAWDVSNVTDMNSMFWYALSFNQPINGWDVSNVTNMSYMFQEVAAFNQSLNNWDVSSVTDMNCMFCYSTYNQPLNNWDVSSVTNIRLECFKCYFHV